LAHILVGDPVPTPDQVRGRLSPEYALADESDVVDAGRQVCRQKRAV